MKLRKPEIRFIPRDKLIVPDNIQKKINRPLIRKMVEDFNEDCFPMLLVCSNGKGLYEVLDGQHSLEVGDMKEFSGHWCILTKDVKKRQDKHRIVVLRNDRSKLRTEDQFFQNYKAGEIDHIETQKIIEGMSYSTVVDHMDHPERIRIRGVQLCLKIHRRNKANGTLIGLEDILYVTSASWPEEGEGIRAPVLAGLAFFMNIIDDEFDLDSLAKALRLIAPERLLEKARFRTASEGPGTKQDRVFAQLIADLCNKGKRRNSKGHISLDVE